MTEPHAELFRLADIDDTIDYLVPTIWPDFIDIFRREITAYYDLPDVFWPHGFIVRENGKVAGFALIITSSLSHQACELCWVMVHPDHRRHGIGEVLVRACIAKASAREQTMLFSSFRSQLYEKLGLQPVGEWRPGRYYYIVQPHALADR